MQLNCCNALGISESLVTRLQLAYVQNSAARLLTNTRKRDNITPVLVLSRIQAMNFWSLSSRGHSHITGLSHSYRSPF